MKDFLKGMAAVIIALALLPIVAVVAEYLGQPKTAPVISSEINEPAPSEPESYALITDVIVLDTVKGQTFTLGIEDYIVASLLADEFEGGEDELIKAQAVIYYTYILSRRISEVEDPTLSLMGADISTDRSKYLPIRLPSPEESEEVLRLKGLISEVLGRYIAYKGEPIEPVFCYSSGGDTQASRTVFGEDIPYLRSVDSKSDNGYTTVTAYTRAEVFARLSTAGKGYDIYTEPEKWITVSSANPDGYIKEIILDGRFTLTGRELAGILNLPSAKFSVTYNPSGDTFTFTALGRGHLVGLSLYGSNEMAKKGYTWQEILTHYYTDVEIT